MDCELLIVGGSAGGTAAALAAASTGASVCLLEETGWLGGQLTTQGVCTPDEQKYIETFGGTRRYYAFREATRNYYRQNFQMKPEASAKPELNVGNCWVSRLSFEPKVGVKILREMTRPFEDAGILRIFFHTRIVACEMDAAGNAITTVLARNEDGTETRFTPRFVLDATDLGDVLPLCGTEGADWVIGAESQTETGEPDAPDTARLDWVQPFTFPFALDWSPDTADTNVIAPPEDYEELKAQQKYQIGDGAITGIFQGAMPWWRYRRVLDAANFDAPRIPADVAMINTGGNDYKGGNILGAKVGSEADVQATLARGRRTSLGYVYWLQTECPREGDPTGTKRGYPEFRLRKDVFDTPDGCSIQPYIRESRRIKAVRRVLEQEIVVKDFSGTVCQPHARAAFMPDSVGVGHYALDIHPNGNGEPNHYVATRPFQIPLGALIPVRLENLLPACKNLGTTHLSNGAYRLHPIEWNVGESAGLLAACCLQYNCTPREIYADTNLQREFQTVLLREGIPLYWVVDVPLNHPAFAAVQKLALTGAAVGSPDDLLFHPDEPVTPEVWQAWREKTAISAAPKTFAGTRSEAALVLYPSL